MSTSEKQLQTDTSISIYAKTFLSNTNDIVYILNPEGTIVNIWGPTDNAIGLAPQEIVGKPWDFLLWDKDREKARWHVNERRTGERATRGHLLRFAAWRGDLLPSENWLPVEVNASGVYDRDVKDIDKRFLGTIGIARDVSQLQRYENAIKQSKQKFKTFFENELIGLFKTRIEDGAMLACNYKAARMLGYKDPLECVAFFKASESYIDPDYRRKMLEQLQTQGAIETTEACIRRPDGSMLWICYSAQIDHAEGCIEGAMMDSTKLREAEKAAREKDHMFKVLFDGISDPMMMLDSEMRVGMINPAGLAYYERRDMGGILGRPCFEGLRARGKPCPGCRIGRMAGVAGSCRYEQESLVKPGRLEEIHIESLRMDNETGMSGMIVRVTDITERRSIEAQMMRSARLASIGQLAAGIAHEIRNPLSSIQLYAGLLDEHAYAGDSTEIRDIISEIKENSARINRIVTQVLSLARDKRDAGEEYLDINCLIEQTIKFCGSPCNESKIRLDLNLMEHLPVIKGEKTLIQQAVLNLIQNAYEAVGKEGNISIRTDEASCDFSPAGKSVIIEVRDNGSGISLENRENVFNPFFTTKTGGIGLGLSITHKIIEKHNGIIHVASGEANRGTAVRIELPAVMRDAS